MMMYGGMKVKIQIFLTSFNTDPVWIAAVQGLINACPMSRVYINIKSSKILLLSDEP
jgi:hypothetical protein